MLLRTTVFDVALQNLTFGNAELAAMGVIQGGQFILTDQVSSLVLVGKMMLQRFTLPKLLDFGAFGRVAEFGNELVDR